LIRNPKKKNQTVHELDVSVAPELVVTYRSVTLQEGRRIFRLLPSDNENRGCPENEQQSTTVLAVKMVDVTELFP
jgi:hypothetical protein